ncbi:MAG: DUF2220 domain-containing protein [Acholeplasmataceae bacterium]|nr:DUF2220 domain-containing protein [Acholeplasmataceae bacterium]
MIEKWKIQIVNRLMSVYEKRYDSRSDFKTKVSIKAGEDRFIEYGHPDFYQEMAAIEKAVSDMEKQGFIIVKRDRFSKEIISISLVIDRVEQMCDHFGIERPSEKYDRLFDILSRYPNPLISSYQAFLESRLSKKNTIKMHLNGLDDLEDALKVITFSENNQDDILERNASIRLFGDSKRLQQVKGRIDVIIRTVLDEDGRIYLQQSGILKNPVHTFMKGQGMVLIGQESISLDCVPGSIGVESGMMHALSFANIERVITIENLTTFHTFDEPGLIIYLGGFSNHAKRELLGKLRDSSHEFLHFGDLDYGGFMILDHLRRSTGIDIKAHHMDIGMLKQYSRYTKHVEKNSAYMKKLISLLDLETLKVSHETIRFMIEHQVILEQEAIDA